MLDNLAPDEGDAMASRETEALRETVTRTNSQVEHFGGSPPKAPLDMSKTTSPGRQAAASTAQISSTLSPARASLPTARRSVASSAGEKSASAASGSCGLE